jgi:hypothetical protein
LTNCDASKSTIVAQKYCDIPIISLLGAPYNLGLGESVQVRMTATNYYGQNQLSDAFNGATMIILPDAP